MVSHSSMEPTKVDGFQAPGSFSQTIYYSVDTEVISRLLHQSASCSQSLRYDCKKSKLFGTNKGEQSRHSINCSHVPPNRTCQFDSIRLSIFQTETGGRTGGGSPGRVRGWSTGQGPPRGQDNVAAASRGHVYTPTSAVTVTQPRRPGVTTLASWRTWTASP